jgi:hypothetical protein
MAISLWWVCLGQYAPYNRKNRVWLNNLSNQVPVYLPIARVLCELLQKATFQKFNQVDQN